MLTRTRCPGCGAEQLSPLQSCQTKEAMISIALCEGCGLTFVNPMFEDSDKATLQPNVRLLHRSRSAELDDAKALGRSRARAQRWEYAIHHWLKPKSRVLEIGAGDGALVELLLEHGHTPVALDPDADSCRYIHDRFGIKTIASRVEEADIDAEGEFDAVFMLNLIEHLEDPAAVLRELRRFLKQDGIVGIETPNILRTKVGPKRMYSFPHNYYFSPTSLLNMAVQQGYAPVQSREFPLDMFHLIVRKKEHVEPLPADSLSAEAKRVRHAIQNHRWSYYLRGQFLLRKLPGFRQTYLYGNPSDRLFEHPPGNQPGVPGQ